MRKNHSQQRLQSRPHASFPRTHPYILSLQAECTQSLRGIAEAEFWEAMKTLEDSGLGKVCSRGSHLLQIPFLSRWPRFYHMVEWIEWVNTLFTNLSSQAEFQQRFHLPSHRHVTPAIKTQLKSKGYVPSGFFTD